MCTYSLHRIVLIIITRKYSHPMNVEEWVITGYGNEQFINLYFDSFIPND